MTEPAPETGPVAEPSWEAYTALVAHRLDERARGAAFVSGQLAGSAEMTRHADELGDRLDQQASALFQLARAIKVRAPAITPLDPPEGPDGPATRTDPAVRLTEAARKIDETDQLARTADPNYRAPEGALAPGGGTVAPPGPGRLARPGVPGDAPAGPRLSGARPTRGSSSPTGRNVLVYLGGAALTAVAIFVAALRNDGNPPSGLVALFELPAVGFLLSWLFLIRLDRARPRGARGTQPRLGLVILFLTGPVVTVLAVLLSSPSK